MPMGTQNIELKEERDNLFFFFFPDK